MVKYICFHNANELEVLKLWHNVISAERAFLSELKSATHTEDQTEHGKLTLEA